MDRACRRGGELGDGVRLTDDVGPHVDPGRRRHPGSLARQQMSGNRMATIVPDRRRDRVLGAGGVDDGPAVRVLHRLQEVAVVHATVERVTGGLEAVLRAR